MWKYLFAEIFAHITCNFPSTYHNMALFHEAEMALAPFTFKYKTVDNVRLKIPFRIVTVFPVTGSVSLDLHSCHPRFVRQPMSSLPTPSLCPLLILSSS